MSIHAHSRWLYRNYPEVVRPAVTVRAALDPTNPYLTVTELRDEVGLFADDSQDELLAEYLLYATERVEEMIGQTLPARATTDRYACAGARLALSSPGVLAGTAVAVNARLAGSGATLTDVTHGWHLDPGPSPAHLVFTEQPNVDRDGYAMPVEASYTSGIDDTYPVGREQVRQALRYVVSVLYERRGTGALAEKWERGLLSILSVRHRAAV